MKVSVLHPTPRHGSYERDGIVDTGLVVALVKRGGSPLSFHRGPDRLILAADELVMIGPRIRRAVRWDDVVSTSRDKVKRKPVLVVEHMDGDIKVPIHALENSEATKLERLIRRCADEPEVRRRVASGGPGSRGGWPAASE